jgi:hypothetical protein
MQPLLLLLLVLGWRLLLMLAVLAVLAVLREAGGTELPVSLPCGHAPQCIPTKTQCRQKREK